MNSSNSVDMNAGPLSYTRVSGNPHVVKVTHSFAMAADNVVDGTVCTSTHFEYASTIRSSVLPRNDQRDPRGCDSIASLASPMAALGPLVTSSTFSGIWDSAWPCALTLHPFVAPKCSSLRSSSSVQYLGALRGSLQPLLPRAVLALPLSHPRGCSHLLCSVLLFSESADPSLHPLICLASPAASTCEPWLVSGLCLSRSESGQWSPRRHLVVTWVG